MSNPFESTAARRGAILIASGMDKSIVPLFVFLSEKERQEIDMNGTKSPLWSSVAILIGVVIGIFAVTTGKLRQSLLIAAMLVWICGL